MLDLSEKDHDKLDKFVNAVLDGYCNGRLSQLDARADLMQVVAAAAKDNYSGVVPFCETRLAELKKP